MELVEVKKSSVFCDSSMVAKKFGYKHKDVVRIILNLLKDLRGVSNPPKVLTEEREYRGTQYTVYLMSRDFFTLLAMRFKGQKALEWQIKFNSAFYQMEEALVKAHENSQDKEWVSNRQNTKTIRKEHTSTVKRFIEYARTQGNRDKERKWYGTITNTTYQALGLVAMKGTSLRDTLSNLELSELLLAERLATNSLKRYMDLERDYRDVIKSTQEDLENFVNSMRLGIEA